MNKIIFILSIILLTGCSTTERKNNTFSEKKEYYVLRGINYSQNKDYKNAVEQLEKAYLNDKSNTIVMKELAYCHFKLGNMERATDFYKKIIKNYPEDEISLKNLAYMSYQKKEFSDAKNYLDLVAETDRDVFYYKLYGYIYYGQNKYESAYIYFDKVSKVAFDYDNIFFKRYVEILIHQKKDGELYQILEEKYKKYYLNREYVELYSSLMSKRYSEFEKSERAIKRYIIENPNDNEMILNLAELNIKNGDYTKGKEQLTFVADEYKYNKRYVELVDMIEKE